MGTTLGTALGTDTGPCGAHGAMWGTRAPWGHGGTRAQAGTSRAITAGGTQHRKLAAFPPWEGAGARPSEEEEESAGPEPLDFRG